MSTWVRASLVILLGLAATSVHAVNLRPAQVSGPEGSRSQVTLVINRFDFQFLQIACGGSESFYEFTYTISGGDGTANWSDSVGDDLFLQDETNALVSTTGQGSQRTIQVCGQPEEDVRVPFFVNYATDNIINEGTENATLEVNAFCPLQEGSCSDSTNVSVVDATPVPRASISGGSASESATSGTFMVTLDTAAPVDLDIPVAATDGSTADNPEEWQFQGPSPDQYVVTIGAGQTSGVATFDLFDDQTAEANEIIAVMLEPGANYELGAPSSAQFTIIDDDMAGVLVTPQSVTVSESGGSAQFDVVLESEPNADVEIAVSSSDAAEATVDKDALVFNAGNWDMPQSVTVTGVNDDVNDGDSDFLILLSASSEDPGYASADVPNVAGINTDDDEAPGVEFTMTSYVVAENVGSAEIQVRRTGAVGQAFTANFMTVDDGPGTTATAGDDYTSVNRDLVWAPGEEDEKIIAIDIIDDVLDEGDETLELKLQTDGGAIEVRSELVIQNDFIEDAIAQIAPDDLPENVRQIAVLILETCPQGNNLPDFQALCTDIVVEAIEGGTVGDALQEIAADSASTVRKPSMDSARVQNINVTGRLAELRRGAAGISFRNFSFNMAGVNLNQSMLSGFMNGSSANGAFNVSNPALPLPSYALSGGNAGVANANASGDSTLDDFGRWGVWVGGRVIFGDKDPTAAEDGYDFNTGGLTLGVDYRFTNSFVAGLALGYSDNDADLDSSDSGLDSDGLGLTVYGNWFPTDNFYLDGSITFGQNSFDQRRQIQYSLPMVGAVVDQTLRADFDGDQKSLTLGAGYDFESNGWIFGPTLFVEYIDVDIDGYDERLTNSGGAGIAVGWATHIDAQQFESLIPTIGFQASKALSFDWGVLVPQGNIGWATELEDNGAVISGYYLGDVNRVPFALETDALDDDFFRAGLGLSAVFPGNKSGFLYVDGDFDRDLISTYYINAGFRWEF